MTQFKLSNVLVGFVILGMLIGCVTGIYQYIESSYDITRDDTVGGYSVGERIDNLLIVQAMEQSVAGIYDIIQPSNPLDVVGGLLASGYGIATAIVGTLTFPAEIISILGDHYFIPPQIYVSVIVIFYIYIAFILFNLITRSDN